MKIKKAVLAALLACGMLTGCLGRGGSSTLNEEGSRIFATEEGVFQTVTVEAYADQDYYRAEELKTYLEETVSAYNEAHGQGAVTLDSCTLEKGSAKMIFSYSSGEALAGFASQYEDKANQVGSIFVSPLSKVLSQSQSEGVVFLKASDGKEVDGKALLNKGESHAVVVETQTPVTLQTQGRLLFVSDNADVRDHYTVQLTKGKSYIIFK